MIVSSDKQPEVAQPNGQADPAHGMTVGQVAKYLRIGEDRVRQMIKSGELGALNTAYERGAKPRYVVLPRHLRDWEQQHEVSPEPRQAPRRRRTVMRAGKKDRFPDD
jgi:excisionase family DNA binding protein